MNHPERAILTHYFNPPHIIPIVEIVPGERTEEQVVNKTRILLRQTGKRPIRINKEIPGFLVNRVQTAMYREVWDLLDRGIASAEDIDEAVRGSMGLRLAAVGPLKINDFAGLDVNARSHSLIAPHIRADSDVPDNVQRLVEQGNYGIKTAKGFYDYQPESIRQDLAARDQSYLALVKLLHNEE